MDLSFDASDAGNTAKYKKCPNCKSKYLSANRFVLDRGNAYAVVIYEAHRHNDQPEIYFMCTIGDWSNEDSSSNVTFACRYGEVDGEQEYACTLIDVPESFDYPLVGHTLTRTEGLKSDKLNEFWHVVDFLIESDMTIHDFLHHPLKSKIKNSTAGRTLRR